MLLGITPAVASGEKYVGVAPALESTPSNFQSSPSDVNAEDTMTTSKSYQIIKQIAPELFDNVALVPTVGSNANIIDSRVGGVDVKISTNPSAGISLTDPIADGARLEITLPNAEQATHGAGEAPGVVTYDNRDGSTSTVIVKSDGSVQIVTTIANADAPTEYTYKVSIPKGGRIEASPGGSTVSILDSKGAFVGGFAPAWAKDSNGVSVDTKYTASNGEVTQTVNHRSGDYVYPIVADPWGGNRSGQFLLLELPLSRPQVKRRPNLVGLCMGGQPIVGRSRSCRLGRTQHKDRCLGSGACE